MYNAQSTLLKFILSVDNTTRLVKKKKISNPETKTLKNWNRFKYETRKKLKLFLKPKTVKVKKNYRFQTRNRKVEKCGYSFQT